VSRELKELWLRGDDPAHRRSSDRFDPVAEGHKQGLPHDLSLALWKQACREATDSAGQLNAAHAKRAFYDLVARWVAQGGRVQPDVGRWTRVGIEIDPTQSSAPQPSLLAPRIPGRDTRVAVEARELERTERAAGRSPEATQSAPSERPGTSSVSGAMAQLPQPVRMPQPAFLAPSQSARLSSLFGVDLSRVPIVQNSPAAIGSTKAVTKDGAVHFRTGAYRPGTPDGDWLIAHELAHVAQQRGARDKQPGTTQEIEREADQAAGLAVRGRPAPLRLRAEAGVAYAFDEGEAHDNTAAIDPALEAALKRVGQGEPLHAAVLQELGARLGANFRHVRIHTDDVAARATEALGARAFTVGEDIFFAPSGFDPFREAGQRLLVHELTHVVQSQQGRVPASRGIEISRPSDALELEASAAYEQTAARGPTTMASAADAAPTRAASGMLLRQHTPELRDLFPTKARIQEIANRELALRVARVGAKAMTVRYTAERGARAAKEAYASATGDNGFKAGRVQSPLGGKFLEMYLDHSVDPSAVAAAGLEIQREPNFKKLEAELKAKIHQLEKHLATEGGDERLLETARKHFKGAMKHGVEFKYETNTIIGGVANIEVRDAALIHQDSDGEGLGETMQSEYVINVTFKDSYDFSNRRTGIYDQYRKRLAAHLAKNEYEKFWVDFKNEASGKGKSKLDEAAVFASFMYAIEQKGWTPGPLPWEVTIPIKGTVTIPKPRSALKPELNPGASPKPKLDR